MFCVIYDGNCNLCVGLVRLLESLDQGRQFRYIPMQDQNTLKEFDISPQDCEAGMILINLEHPNQRWQGSNAAEEIGRQLPLGSVFVEAYRALPGVKATGDQVYSYVRDNRYTIFGKRNQQYNSPYSWCGSGNCSPSAANPEETTVSGD